MTFKRAYMALLAVLLLPAMAWAQEGTRTTVLVNKDFTDDNPGEVEVTMSCNTGLPLNQTKMISESPEYVEFVVVDFDSGELDCTVTETAVGGYEAEYSENGGSFSTDACSFVDLEDGDENTCDVRNTPAPVVVTVNKEWIYANANGNEISDDFRIVLVCDAVIDGGYSIGGGSWSASFNSSGDDSNDFSVHPTFGGNSCSASETVYDSAIESDDSDCRSLSIDIAQGDECTITNTVFFEGIPTLSQWGMALMALLMAGVGFAAFRRFA